MANSKVMALRKANWSPEFIDELLPASEQISLLYHISYLCLANFPNLERILRMRAVETQLLLGSSEALLLKCTGTSQNLVSSLFPMLIFAIEKNRPILVVKYLEKARTWIHDIIVDVEKMVLSYAQLSKDVATTVSDVKTEKKNTEEKVTQASEEAKALQKAIQGLDNDLAQTTKQLAETERQIDALNQELQNHVRNMGRRSRRFGIFTSIVPFLGPIIQSIYDGNASSDDAVTVKVLETKLNQLTTDKITLKQKEWGIQVQQINLHMQLAKININLGSIPSPVHLSEVQSHLTKIQQLLIKLKTFWEKVNRMLDSIRDITFVNEDLIEEPDLKDEFVKSIKKASEIWSAFGNFCTKGAEIFKIQNKDAYAFLEIDPSSLTQAVWQEQYLSVKAKLEAIKLWRQTPVAIQD